MSHTNVAGTTHFSSLGVGTNVYNGATNHKAIGIDSGIALLTKATAGTDYTLEAPDAGVGSGQDGTILRITTTTAAAHVVTVGAGLINGATNGTLTFAAAKGNGVTMIAYNGIWYVTSNIGVTVG